MAIMDWIGKNIKFITEKELTNMSKKRFNIDEYPGKYVMYCETQEELFKFYDYLHSVGRRWSMGQSYSDFRPTKSFAGPTRYIYFNDGTHGDWYELLKFKDFDWGDSTMKFKVGDTVRVRKDLKTWNRYGNFRFTEGMKEVFADKATTISHADHSCGCYHLAGDIMCYCWTDEMLELAEEKQFTKADLKTGMVVEIRGGGRYLVIGNRMVNEDDHLLLGDYREDLTDGDDMTDFDIVKVYEINSDYLYDIEDVLLHSSLNLIWERKEEVVKEMSVEEIEKELGYKVKVVNKED